MTEFETQTVFDIADSFFQQGTWPDSQLIAKELSVDAAEVEPVLLEWQASLASRAVLLQNQPEPGDGFRKALESLWQDAVSTAGVHYKEQVQTLSKRYESDLANISGNTQELQEQIEDLQGQLVLLRDQEQLQEQRKQKQASEIAELKKQLSIADKEAVAAEERKNALSSDVQRLQRQLDDTRQNFEQRFKEEQNHYQEQVARLEADLRSSRLQLENRKDDFGKTESALLKQTQDLQAEVSKRDLKIESLTNQSRSIELELKKLQSTQGGQQQNMAQMKKQLLAETNRANRLEEKVDKLTKELALEQQYHKQSGTEAAQKESQLRQENKRLTTEIGNINHQLSIAEKKLANKEDQIKKMRGRPY